MDQPSSEDQSGSTTKSSRYVVPSAGVVISGQSGASPAIQPSGKRWFNRTEVIVISLGCLLLSGLAVVIVILAFVLVPLLRQATNSTTPDVQEYLDRGWELYNQGKLDDAINQYNLALQLDAQNEEAYLKRGIAYMDKNYLVVAINDFSKAIEIAPYDSSGYYDRGLAYYQNSDGPHALEDFNKAIELEPDYVNAYIYRGMLNGWMGKPDESISDLSQAAELEPDNPLAYYFRALAYLDKDDLQAATADLQKTLELCGDKSELCSWAKTQLDELGEGQVPLP